MELCTGGHLGQVLRRAFICKYSPNSEIHNSILPCSFSPLSSPFSPFLSSQVLRIQPDGRLEQDVAKRYITQIAQAVAHCHKHGICHRDIKLQNVLLEDKGKGAQVISHFPFSLSLPFSPFSPFSPFRSPPVIDILTLHVSTPFLPQVKLIDFGNGHRFRGNLPMTKIVGTTYTAAPEVCVVSTPSLSFSFSLLSRTHT